MDIQLTSTQIQQLQRFAAAGNRVGYWSTLAPVDRYGALALGVVTGSTLSGFEARQYMATAAQEMGVPYSSQIEEKIGQQLVAADWTARLMEINGGGTGLNLSARTIYNYHQAVFRGNGLGNLNQAWTIAPFLYPYLQTGDARGCKRPL